MIKAADKLKHAMVQMAITDEAVNKLLDEQVEELLKDKDEMSYSKLIPVCRTGFNTELETPALVAMTDMPPSGEQRQNAFRALGIKLSKELFYKGKKHLSPVAIVFVSEMWYLDVKDKIEDKLVSEHDNRSEGIIVHVMSIDGRNAMALFDITRDKHNKQTRNLKQIMPYKLGQGGTSESYLGRAFFKGVHDYMVKENIGNVTE